MTSISGCPWSETQDPAMRPLKLLVAGLLMMTILFVIIISHRFHHRIEGYKTDTCRTLLTSGRFVGDEWHPNGCKMKVYEPDDIKQCLHRTLNKARNSDVMTFYGDSRIRELFRVMSRTIHKNTSDWNYNKLPEALTNVDHEGDERLEPYGLSRTFIIKADYLYSALKRIASLPTIERPKLLVMDAALWHIFLLKHLTERSELERAVTAELLSYKEYISKCKKLIDKIADTTRTIWIIQAPVFYGSGYFEPNTTVIEEKCEWPCYHWRRDDFLRRYNDVIHSVLGNSSAFVWSQFRQVVSRYVFDLYDGEHSLVPMSRFKSWKKRWVHGSRAELILAQTMWNFYCNRYNNENNDEDLCCTK